MLFAAPFFVLVGSGGSWWRRGWSAGLGAALPVFVLLAYNLVTAGDILHPAYEFLYQAEATYYPTLGYHLDWAIEDPRYIPQNLGIMLFSLPLFAPGHVARFAPRDDRCVLHARRAPRAACSTSRARSPSPTTSG